MPIQTSQVLTIEFLGAGSGLSGPQSAGFPLTRAIRLVESKAGQTRTFTLYEERLPEHVITTAETEKLLLLLRQMAVTAPWQPEVGFDGTNHELALRGAMSSMTFRWWGRVPAEWRSVGKVFDYVMSIADHRSSPT